MSAHETQIVGTTSAGVPYLLTRPSSESAPLVIAWHLLDPPRTEAAFASAMPLAGLDAWKLYLGLPMCGARLPAGGPDAFLGLLASDAPGLVLGPIHEQAVDEASSAVAEVREIAGIAQDAAVGLLGGSMGGAVVVELLARGTFTPRASVLVNPLIAVRPMIDAVSPQFGGYTWTAAGETAAARLDYVTRAPEVREWGHTIRMIVGTEDAPWFTGAAGSFAEATGAEVCPLPGAAHALADEPGVAPAPQTEHARAADALATEWFTRRLV